MCISNTYIIIFADVPVQVAKIIMERDLDEWRNIARGLGMVEGDIQAIEHKYPLDLKNQCRQAISDWWKSNALPLEERLRKLILVLEDEGLKWTAGK